MTKSAVVVIGATVIVGALILGTVSVWAFPSTFLSSPKRGGWRSQPWFASSPTSLPSDVVKYSQVPKQGKKFTATTIPKGLLKDHNTKAGTWGLICVSQGSLEYTILEPTKRVLQLSGPDGTGVIVPQQLHHVKALTDNVEFVVEFYRRPGTGPVEEKREGLEQ